MRKFYRLGMTMLLLLVATLPAAYAYNFESGGIYYDITGTSPNTVAVTYATGSYNSYSGTVNIPSMVTYNGTTYTVTGIGNSAFRNCSGLTGVSIPGTVTSIGEYAFYYCGNLPSVTIPNGVVTIGESAFEKCYILTTVSIPSSVRTISNRVFAQSGLYTLYYSADSCSFEFEYSSNSCFFSCNYFRHLVIGDNVQVIPDYAFYGCNKLDSIFLPNSVSKIGNGAFNSCSNLSYISLSQSLETVGNNAFGGCSSLISISIPASVYNIGEGVFSGCTSLQSLFVADDNLTYDSRNNCNAVIHTASNTLLSGCKNTIIPNTITTIGNSAFGGCSGLTGNLNIPTSVKVIGSSAFGSCTGLSGLLTIPDSVRIIGAYAFSHCTGINALTIGKSVDSIGNGAFSNCSTLTAVTLNADSCTQMGDNYYPEYCVFYQCGSLSSLTIGNNVKAIPNMAFQGCSSLTGMLIIPNSVRTIGHDAFNGCMGLTSSLILPDSLTYIGYGAFSGCNGLTGVLTIPKFMSFIGYRAFSGCSGLSSIIFNADSCTSDVNGSTYILNNIFNDCEGVVSIQIGNNVKFLTDKLFMGISNADTITIPRSVVRIGGSVFPSCINTVLFNADSCIIMSGTSYNGGLSTAFANNSNLTTLIIGDNVKYIPSHAFQGCSHLTGELIIPDSVSIIGQYAFSGCSSLDTLVISESVNTIKQYSFSGCSGLKSLQFPNVDTIEAFAFNGCSGLESLALDGVKYIGNNAFGICSGLTGVLNIPNTVITIGQYAFDGCSGVDSLIIGEGVVSIGTDAFKNCSSLISVVFNADSCISVGQYTYDRVFNGCTSLSVLTIGKHVKNIPGLLFKGCSSLSTVYYNADSCTEASNAFSGTSLTSLSIGENVKHLPSSIFRSLSSLTGTLSIPDSVIKIGDYAFYGCTGLDTLDFGRSVASIGNSAFYHCTGLVGKLNIPNSVTEIGSSAFSGCSGFDTLIIGNSVANIGEYSFSNCIGLSGTLNIPNSVTDISSSAFSGCSGFDTIIIGKGVQTIGSNAFKNCSSITHVNFNADSCIMMGNGYNNQAFNGCNNISMLTIGDNVKVIPSYAFGDCSSLTGTLVIPDSVTLIGSNAFLRCTGINKLILGRSVSEIGRSAFSGCTGLSGMLTIPNKVNHVGASSFSGCNELDSLHIGKNVSAIDTSAFNYCSDLKFIAYNADNCAFVYDYSNHPFYYCNSLNKVVFGNNVKSIPNKAFPQFITKNHFSGHLIIPDSVTRIGNSAFNGCNQIVSITLGRSVSVIDSNAFGSCTGIGSIYSYAETPPTIVTGVNVYNFDTYYYTFYNVDRNIPVYVPCNRKTAYQNAWKHKNYSTYFTNIQESINPYFLTVSSADTTTGTVQVTSQQVSCTSPAVIEATPNFFYVFDHWSDGNTDNPRTIFLSQDTTLVAHFREYTITLASSDSSVGIATTVITPTADNPLATVEAVVTDSCYLFSGWSDGATENPHTISVTQDTLLTAIFNSVVNLQITAPLSVCQGDTVLLAATGAESYLWFNGDTTSVIRLLPENSLDVSVTGTGHNGCSATATHSVNVLSRPNLIVSGLIDICEGESTILTANGNGPTEELVLFEDFEDGLDGWNTMDFDGDGHNWYSTLGTVQSAYEGNGAAASDSWWNYQALTPNNILYKEVHIPNTGGQLSWHAATQDPHWSAEHYEVYVYTNSGSSWIPTSIFNETLSDDQWVHHTVDLNVWAGEDVLIGFVHNNCSNQYALKIDNVRIVTLISYTYDWSNGHTGNQISVNNAGTYYVTATKPNGCTSTDSVIITVWQPDTVDITINSPNNYYVMNDETFCTSGDYTQTLQNIHGCDSVINLHLTLAPRDTVFITDTVCRGRHEIYWNNSSYDTTYSVYFNDIFNESIYSIAGYGGWGEAIVYDDLYGSEYEGLIYGFHVSGEYYQNDSLWIQYDETRTLQAVSGCDSVVKKHHYVKFSDWYSLRDTACGSYVWQGDTITANPNNLIRWLYAESVNAQGCDSSVELRLTLLPAIEESVTITACDSYIWNGTTYTESGVYTYNMDTTLQETPACKLTTLYLTINSSVTESFEATACDSYTWNDSIYTTSGEYTQTFTAANGCDSTVTLQLIINESKHTDTTAESCGSYTWNEITYTTSGEYTQTFTAVNGCDSTVTLQLTILPLPTPNITGVTTVCEGQTATLNATGGVSYLWEDGTTTNTYPATVSGLYTVTVTNAEGCSAMASTTVTVNPLPEVVITGNTTICPGGNTILTATGADSYQWSNGSTNPSIPVNMFGQYSVIGTSAAGCFSTASVTVLVSQPPVITVSGNTDICAGESTTLTANGGVSYMWSNGSTADTLVATTAGTWQVIGYNADGCSNMASVTVNLWQPASTNLYITSFDSCYMWFGTPRCESGDYTHTLQTIHGCDSVIILHLTLEDAITTEFSATSCDSYTWNWATYTVSGNYTQSFTAFNGNDSIVTLHLTINNPVHTAFTAESCGAYDWNGQTYTVSGDYTYEHLDANGCTQVDTLHLTIFNPVHTAITAGSCGSYVWNGQTYTESGDYTYEHLDANGCTQVDTLHLTVNDTKHVEFADSTCTAYTWNGQTYASSGDYTQTFTAANGCDSVVTLHLTIVPTITPAIAVTGSLTACDNGSATLSVLGNYSNFVWSTGAITPTITVSEAGYYWVTATDAFGCEGVSEMVQLGGSTQIDETPAICMVGVDNDHNLVVWEPLTDPDVSEYRIYREDGQANIFEPLAVIPASNSNAYVDTTADPSVRAYRYKITAADTCGGETPMSAFHKTVHLTINQGLGNSYNLIWTPYEGFEFSSYKLYRGTANNNLQLIQTMPSTLTSYTDNNPAGDALFYQIEVVMTESCVQQTRDITYTGARSNIVYNGVAVTTEVTIEACDSYDWNGQILTSSGDYTQNFVSELGYDSVVTLHLTINPSVTEVIEVTTPDSCYTWNGQDYCTSGTYTQTLQTVHGCDSVVTMHLTITVGVNDYDGFDFKVYPNPTTGVVYIQITNLNSPITEFHVFDAYGKLIRVVDVQTTQIDLSGLANGVYFVKAVSDGNVVAVRKVVKH